MIKLNCPKCGTQMRSYDNESLFHPSIKDVADGIPPIDGVIYVLVLCDNCGHKHNQEFDIVLREQPKVPTQMVSCPKCGNDTEKPVPELVQPDTYGEVNCTCGNVYYYPHYNRNIKSNEIY
jgi:predicted nucleic-acid-binding Zn-ribbon protein